MSEDDRKESWLSILCHDVWRWDAEDWNRIQFNKNGTGELICKYENNIWIAAQLEWKFKEPTTLQQFTEQITTSQTPAPVTVEITLLKERIQSLQGPRWDKSQLNEKVLTDAAFEPKTYVLNLEKGRFRTPHELLKDGKNCPDWAPWFAYRLSFDESPYPPREQWKYADQEKIPDVYKFWEWTQFCNNQLPPESEDKSWGGWMRSKLGL